jgi:hypothetical protein
MGRISRGFKGKPSGPAAPNRQKPNVRALPPGGFSGSKVWPPIPDQQNPIKRLVPETGERHHMNTVNPDNFNETLKGYLIRALRESGASQPDCEKIFAGLRWALSEMTMQDAREEWEKYTKGLIKFKE